jgi:hypothetical protein
MAKSINAEQVRSWIDDELVEDVDQMPDNAAEFNLTIEISNMLIHVIRRQPEGPLLVGQQIEYGDEIRSRIRGLSETDQNDLVARIRETLTTVPVVYGFHDEHGNNVRFGDMYRIFIEHRIYPDAMDQHTLMSGLVDVWKAMRYLDDIVALIDSVENR